MSDRDQEIETKAGHPPALKVGGMRVSQRSRSPGAEGSAQDPENPQIPAKESGTDGDASIQGIGGLQSKPKDLLVNKGTSGIPVTAKDLEIQNEGVKHTHDKGIAASALGNKQSEYQNPNFRKDHQHQEPRNHGTNH